MLFPGCFLSSLQAQGDLYVTQCPFLIESSCFSCEWQMWEEQVMQSSISVLRTLMIPNTDKTDACGSSSLINGEKQSPIATLYI